LNRAFALHIDCQFVFGSSLFTAYIADIDKAAAGISRMITCFFAVENGVFCLNDDIGFCRAENGEFMISFFNYFRIS
jgi:hypothetical protein